MEITADDRLLFADPSTDRTSTICNMLCSDGTLYYHNLLQYPNNFLVERDKKGMNFKDYIGEVLQLNSYMILVNFYCISKGNNKSVMMYIAIFEI
jgi:hypothetical protein